MVEGSCLCGKITYRIDIYPDKVFNCHCRFCRKAHGADYATMAMADAASLTLNDESGCLREHQGAAGGYRAFCADCGTRLMNYSPDRQRFFLIALSTVDTPLEVKPAAHINLESKAPWCEPAAGIPQFPAFPEGV
ncbi:GFA family protein [Salinicola endophyticus]|uniref:GFA family protein n=1 Tax=Salinicola endophyticus TaxID=1949083 RepID=A0AB74UAW2_9GAMM